MQHELKLRTTHYCERFTPCRSDNRWSDDRQGKVLRLLGDDVFRQRLGERVRVRSIADNFARQNVEDLIVHPFARIEQFAWLNGRWIDHLRHIASIAIGVRSRNVHNRLKSTASFREPGTRTSNTAYLQLLHLVAERHELLHGSHVHLNGESRTNAS